MDKLTSFSNRYLQKDGNLQNACIQEWHLADATASGNIYPAIGGWTQNSEMLYGGTDIDFIALNAGVGIWMGSPTITTAPFSVTPLGVLKAQSGTIGGWTISPGGLYTGSGSSYIGLIPGVGIYAGSELMTDSSFYITNEGNVTANYITVLGGSVGGWQVYPTYMQYGTGDNIITIAASGTYSIYAGSPTPSLAPFSVSTNGNLVATNAIISGEITATTGQIGGWDIDSDNLNSGAGSQYMELQPSTGIWIGNPSPELAPFLVTNTGELYSTSGEIGGWTIAAGDLTSGTGLNSVGLGTSTYSIWAGSATPSSAPFHVTSAGSLFAQGGIISGWNLTNTGFYSGSGSNYVSVSNSGWAFWAGSPDAYNAPFSVTNTGIVTLTGLQYISLGTGSNILAGIVIQAGAINANAINATTLSAISADMGNITAGNITGATIQTSANASGDYVKMTPEGIIGWNPSYGVVFSLPTDGTPPIFSAGVIQEVTINNSSIESSTFQTASALPYLIITENGIEYQETGGGTLYDQAEYNTKTYGAGASAYLLNPSRPTISIEEENGNGYADIRLYNRSAVPSGYSQVGDIICLDNGLAFCTSPGTPGTYSTFLGSSAIGSTVQAYNSNLTGINQALTTSSSPTFSTVTASINGNAATVTNGLYTTNIGSTVQAYNSNLTAINQALTSTSSPSFTTVTAALSGNATTSTTAGNLSGTPALPNGTTATTQAVGDNSTKVATTAYVNGITKPTIQKFTSGSGTYTTPANVTWIKVRMVGGGGGGGGSGTTESTSGGTGGSTTFGSSLLSAGYGNGASFHNNSTSGGSSSTINSPAIGFSMTGGCGAKGTNLTNTTYTEGGNGGNSVFGGGGGGGPNINTASPIAGMTNTGGGGGGGGGSTGYGGDGGGAGSYVEAIIVSPSSTYSYAVGAGGSAGAAGTGGYVGAAGGSGFIIVEEHYGA